MLVFAVQLLCVIPARLGSTRLPHKPLRLLSGEPLVRLVTRRALELGVAQEVVVATDDQRIVDAVAPLGVEGVLTDPALRSGTERVAAVAGMARFARFDAVLNLQGDEPFFARAAVEGAVERVQGGDPIGTAAAPLAADDLTNPHRVKVVVDGRGHALRFSRALPASATWSCEVVVRHHIGIYAYERRALLRWAALPEAVEERAEGLEQVRPLAYGIPIGVGQIDVPAAPSVDTDEDLAAAERYADTMSQRVGR